MILDSLVRWVTKPKSWRLWKEPLFIWLLKLLNRSPTIILQIYGVLVSYFMNLLQEILPLQRLILSHWLSISVKILSFTHNSSVEISKIFLKDFWIKIQRKDWDGLSFCIILLLRKLRCKKIKEKEKHKNSHHGFNKMLLLKKSKD